ncbi:MAG: hypothetical protein M1834_001315 [Cirrosporium novae-zelandiae]|nr:MAG: hypothetical protein M1834_001315 [Cirrosporium novae-zelandiae]
MATPSSMRSPSRPESTIADDENVLTPRSKIRAMMAAIDDDSDDENTTLNPTQINNAQNSASLHQDTILSDAKSDTEASVSGSDGEDDDDVPIIPRGRLAARLLGKSKEISNVSSHSKTDNKSDDDNAYEKIKKQLMGESKVHKFSPARNQVSGVAPPENSDSDEIHDTTRRKKLKSGVRKPSIEQSSTPARSRETTPAFFVTPGKGSPTPIRQGASESDSDPDLPLNPVSKSRLEELIAKKREERLAREAAARKKKEDMVANLEALSQKAVRENGGTFSETDSDGEAKQRLTQGSRPTRKSSKKAIEEMKRETQRMERNMQLAHQARTKKKVTKESLFAKFNFRPVGMAAEASAQQAPSAPPESSSQSSIENDQEKSTPPTSPLREGSPEKPTALVNITNMDTTETPELNVEEEMPTLDELIIQSQAAPASDKGKGRLIDFEHSKDQMQSAKAPIKSSSHPKMSPKRDFHMTLDSDDSDGLEIVRDAKPRKFAVFDRIPIRQAQENHSLHTLRALAHLSSPGKQPSKSRVSMTPAQMEASLRQRAREQAARERLEKLERLKAQNPNMIFETAEETEKRQLAIEDMVEKARQEAEEISKREKAAAKKEGKSGEHFIDSDDEDEDYIEEGEEADVEVDPEEEEDEEDEDDGGDDGEEPDGGVELPNAPEGVMVEEEAEETEDDELAEKEKENEDADDEDEEANILPTRRKRRMHRIIDDDEADEEPISQSITSAPVTPAVKTPTRPVIPGLPMSDVTPMGLTQAFAATMADNSQIDDDSMDVDNEQESLTFLRQMPDFNPPSMSTPGFGSQNVITDSQSSPVRKAPGWENPTPSRPQTANIDLDFTQSQIVRDSFSGTQTQGLDLLSQIPDPSQDQGFDPISPFKHRFSLPSQQTIDTTSIRSQKEASTPPRKERKRLRKRLEAVPKLSDVDEATNEELNSADEDDLLFDSPTGGRKLDIFDIMKAASRKRTRPAAEVFDKANSIAKEMVEEQAEESEDEYKGIGGPSDDERDDGEMDEEIRKMINDDGKEKVNERELAALHADRSRNEDEKVVKKLFNDISKGMLRRRHNGNNEFDLSDSDDDMEARRRIKRTEFARMRKALLADENVEKISEDPKKAAFFNTLRDFDDGGDELDFLEGEDQPMTDLQELSQSQPQSQEPGEGQQTHQETTSASDPTTLPQKRKRPLTETTNPPPRPPPHLRRTSKSLPGTKKPTTLSEIRESVSFLTESHSASASSSFSVSDDSEDSDTNDDGNAKKGTHTAGVENSDPFAIRHRAIIDRLALRRENSNLSNNNTTANPPSNPKPPGFSLPHHLLLRRSTSSSLSSLSNSGNTTPTGVVVETERMAGTNGSTNAITTAAGGSRKSSINYFSRVEERKKGIVAVVEKRKVESRRKRARERGGVLGSLVREEWG